MLARVWTMKMREQSAVMPTAASTSRTILPWTLTLMYRPYGPRAVGAAPTSDSNQTGRYWLRDRAGQSVHTLEVAQRIRVGSAFVRRGGPFRPARRQSGDRNVRRTRRTNYRRRP